MYKACMCCGISIDSEETYCDRCTAALLYKSPLDVQEDVFAAQVNGDHYSKLGDYQPWIVLKHWLTPEELRGYMKGTVISYLAREKDKGKDDDIAKAEHTMALFHKLCLDKEKKGMA